MSPAQANIAPDPFADPVTGGLRTRMHLTIEPNYRAWLLSLVIELRIRSSGWLHRWNSQALERWNLKPANGNRQPVAIELWQCGSVDLWSWQAVELWICWFTEPSLSLSNPQHLPPISIQRTEMTTPCILRSSSRSASGCWRYVCMRSGQSETGGNQTSLFRFFERPAQRSLAQPWVFQGIGKSTSTPAHYTQQLPPSLAVPYITSRLNVRDGGRFSGLLYPSSAALQQEDPKPDILKFRLTLGCWIPK